MSNNFVIIVAAGTGTRMNGKLPKQFIPLDGKPILMHTMDKFRASSTNPTIILVLSEGMQSFWEESCQAQQYQNTPHICVGGSSRFQSVKNGIDYIQENFGQKEIGKIAVHDAARPLLSSKLIDELYEQCSEGRQAVIPAVQSSNSVRVGTQESNAAVDRQQVWLVQTPQVFIGKLIIKAYEQEESPLFTDDASVIEQMSNSIYLHPGEQQNLKITFAEDLAIAHLLLNKSST